MSQQTALRLAGQAVRSARTAPVVRASVPPIRHISYSSGRRNKDDPYHDHSSATLGRPGFEHEGSASRTDNQISFEYPDKDFPLEAPIQGRGGSNMKRTLPSFSLEGRVGVVTGGARGLGLVMGQAIVASGGDLAIVDLNSMVTILLRNIIC